MFEQPWFVSAPACNSKRTMWCVPRQHASWRGDPNLPLRFTENPAWSSSSTIDRLWLLTAACSDVSPVKSSASWALASNKICTILRFPREAANPSAVANFQFLLRPHTFSTFALALSSRRRTGMRLWKTASIKGVTWKFSSGWNRPALLWSSPVVKSLSAPASSRSCTISTEPKSDAPCNGRQPHLWILKFGSAGTWSNSSIFHLLQLARASRNLRANLVEAKGSRSSCRPSGNLLSSPVTVPSSGNTIPQRSKRCWKRGTPCTASR